MTDFGWDYPPGVSGNEPEIQGQEECTECGNILDEDGCCTLCSQAAGEFEEMAPTREELGYSAASDDLPVWTP